MGAWDFAEQEHGSDFVRFSVLRDGQSVSWLEVIEAMQRDATFGSALSEVILSSDFDQLFWETIPVDIERCGEPFEFALVRAGLGSGADSSAFAEFFDAVTTVATFENLSGSAVLVSPAPMSDAADRSFLKPFLATAPTSQVQELWRAVGAAVLGRLSDQPVWVSTAGGGVPWLHVRLDNSPKYYSCDEFRVWPPAI